MDPNQKPKARKLKDRSLPNVIIQNPDFAEDSEMYSSLLEMERKLDWTMSRKRMEIQDALARVPNTTRQLRIFMSHTVSGQPWQVGGDAEVPSLDNDENVPSWSLKLEGRLLDLPNQRSRDKAPQRKFSTFVKKMVIDMDRDPNLYPDANIVEWPRNAIQNPALDGFTLKRLGDQPTKIRVCIHLEHFPEQFKVHPDLGSIVGIKEDSRVGVIQALWNYIKIQGLQDKVDRRMVRADDQLRRIFGVESMQFQKLPEIVNRYLQPPDPIVLMYDLDPTELPPERPMAWDVEIKTEDTVLKNKMNTMLSTNKESTQRIAKLDEEIAMRAQSLHNSHLKRTFLQSFSKDPAQFIQTWLESQSRDLETILASGPSEGLTVRQEELKRSEFFKLPWVEEAVAVQEGYRITQNRGQALI